MKVFALTFTTILLVVMNFSDAYTQPLLRTENAKICYYSNGIWSQWPDEWTPLTAKFRFTQIDAFGMLFRVEVNLEGYSVNSRFTYEGYDSDQNWFKYKEVGSTDEIAIQGVKMSYLATHGWPDYNVQIYIWSINSRKAIVFD